jgi:hypothetical protein
MADVPLWHFRGFMQLWFARLAGTSASQMMMVAVGWQMYDLTRSAWDLGLVGLFQFAPSLALVLWAGHVIDRHHRARIVAACLAAQALDVKQHPVRITFDLESDPQAFAAVDSTGEPREWAELLSKFGFEQHRVSAVSEGLDFIVGFGGQHANALIAGEISKKCASLRALSVQQPGAGEVHDGCNLPGKPLGAGLLFGRSEQLQPGRQAGADQQGNQPERSPEQ